MKIVFEQNEPKATNMLVRFDPQTDQRIRDIAALEDQSIVSVVRALVRGGLEIYDGRH